MLLFRSRRQVALLSVVLMGVLAMVLFWFLRGRHIVVRRCGFVTDLAASRMTGIDLESVVVRSDRALLDLRTRFEDDRYVESGASERILIGLPELPVQGTVVRVAGSALKMVAYQGSDVMGGVTATKGRGEIVVRGDQARIDIVLTESNGKPIDEVRLSGSFPLKLNEGDEVLITRYHDAACLACGPSVLPVGVQPRDETRQAQGARAPG